MDKEQTYEPISWPGVFVAGAVATLVVTVTMLLTGTNILAGLGTMIAGPEVSDSMRYTVGIMAHLSVGIVYAVVFSLLFSALDWHWLTKGVIFGFVITVMAVVAMPLAASMVAGNSPVTANPCAMKNPCSPVNPCAGRHSQAQNPCQRTMANPCSAANPCAMKNPCSPVNPCAGSHGRAQNPCQRAMANPCSAGNPCAGSGGGQKYAGLLSLINHIVFALVLSLMITRRRIV